MIAPAQMQQAQPLTLAQAPMPQVDVERKNKMKHAWKSYHGELQDPLKIARDQPNDNVKSNRCAPIVDKGVSFLFGQVLKIECDDQDFVDGLWGDDDERMTLLSSWAINGGVCGEGFIKLIPAQGAMKYPRLVVLDPLLIRIVTAPEDCSFVLAYVLEYPGQNDWQKRQIISRVDPDGLADIAGSYDYDDTWSITNYMRKGQTGVWMQVGDAEEWPYPFAPIFSNQNLPAPNEAWGRADLTPDIIEMNSVLNFVQSNTARILKFHAHPKTYATGLSATQINIGVDDLICLPSPDSKLQNLEMHGDLASSRNFAADLRADMDEQSRVPAVALGRLESLPKGNISGVALELLFQPLIEKTIQKQRLYGCAIRDITRAAMVVAGKISVEEYEDYEVDLHWQNLLPVDDVAAAQTALIWKQLGVSASTLLQGAGFDPDAEADKSADEESKQLEQYAKGQGLPPAPTPPGQQPMQPNQPPAPPQVAQQQPPAQGGAKA